MDIKKILASASARTTKNTSLPGLWESEAEKEAREIKQDYEDRKRQGKFYINKF